MTSQENKLSYGVAERQAGGTAPRPVGRPPADACVGLIRVEGGEVRHYPFEGVFRLGDSKEMAYTRSRDGGWTWDEEPFPGPRELLGARTVRRNPATGEFLAVEEGFRWFARARDIDGPWEKWDIGLANGSLRWVRDIYFTRGGRRLVIGVQEDLGCRALYSDDNGATWGESNAVTAPDHKAGGRDLAPRWNHGPVEPCIVELNDGRLWMLIRTSQDNHYQSCSDDGGATWSPAEPSRFFGTCTMCTMGRLDDGRLLMSWNNTLPMPELPGPRRPGWEDVFTNRDATQVAISDDGETWRGFRELYLGERRNAADYAETGGTDRGVHQSEFLDIGGGWVLVSLGQHPLHRRLVVFHTDWLYERSRSDDFSNGLCDWCTFKYVAEIRGHCAYNRKEGACLVDHPHEPGRKALHIRRLPDPSLVSENDGATWNFPAGRSGKFATRLLLPPGGQGGRISLLDRWVNPSDATAEQFAMFTLEMPGSGKIGDKSQLTPGKWHVLKLVWERLDDIGRDHCQLLVDSAPSLRLPLKRTSQNGISYVHFISTANSRDTAGFLVDRVQADLR